MKFSFKLLLWTMIVMALGFGFSGYYFVNYVFQTSMDREVNQAMMRAAFSVLHLRQLPSMCRPSMMCSRIPR